MNVQDKELKEIVVKYKKLLAEEHEDMLEYFGIDTLLKLCDYFGGCQIYIPTKRRMFKYPIEKHVTNIYDGKNTLKLCRKFDIQERRLKSLVSEIKL